jgi:hypothetical protein
MVAVIGVDNWFGRFGIRYYLYSATSYVLSSLLLVEEVGGRV